MAVLLLAGRKPKPQPGARKATTPRKSPHGAHMPRVGGNVTCYKGL